MKKKVLTGIVIFVLVLAANVLGATKEFMVQTSSLSGTDVPYVISFSKMLEMVGDNFEANWYSIRVYDESNKELPYQIEDIDMNRKISAGDRLAFMFRSKAKIVVSDDSDMDLGEYAPVFNIEEKDGAYMVSTDKFTVKVDNHALVSFIKYGANEGTLFNELGIVRVAGWSMNTYYTDGKLGKHEENVSAGFDVQSFKILQAGPVCVTAQALMTTKLFPGYNQELTVHIFKNGDVLTENRFFFTNYVNLMKLQIMATAPVTSYDEGAVHILPMFRRMIWTDQLNSTPYEYWLERNAVKMVENKPYITFAAIDSVKPFWWGAAYIFSSMESWRANFSEKYSIGAAEILPVKPLVYGDMEKFVNGDTWVYESREFRDGIFRWMPDEFNVYESTKGVFLPYSDENVGNQWMAKFKANDEVIYTRIYSMFDAKNTEDAVRYLENKTKDIQGIKLSK